MPQYVGDTQGFEIVDVPGKGKRWYNRQTGEYRTHLQGVSIAPQRGGPTSFFTDAATSLQGAPAGGYGSSADFGQFDPRNLLATGKSIVDRLLGKNQDATPGRDPSIPKVTYPEAAPNATYPEYVPPDLDPRSPLFVQTEAPPAPVLPPPTPAVATPTPSLEPAPTEAPTGYKRDYVPDASPLLQKLNMMEKESMDNLGMEYQGVDDYDEMLDRMIKEKNKTKK